ncbi:MAG: FeoB small GTPase domain-containing protein, partial [Anaerolineaceae bacterium]
MTVHLTDLESGAQGMVHRLTGGHSLVSRLAALGFTPGAPVTVLRSGSGGPLLVSIRGSRVALGIGEAENIEVLGVTGENAETPPLTPESAARVIALAGQPNVGKSTVFNLLTGMNQHVGNWTGKTVEQKKGDFSYKQTAYTLVDLPGTYSLTAASEEERIAREFILHDHPDLVVAVVDAAVLERSLYLLAELLLLPAPVILALNMMDVAEKEGIHVEPKVLETALGIPVVPMAASHNQGMQELLETIEAMEQGSIPYHPNRPSILPAHREVLAQLQKLIEPATPQDLPAGWAALKLLEGDEELIRLFQAQ